MEVIGRAGQAERIGLGSFHRRVAGAFHRARWPGQIALDPREVAVVRLSPRPLARPWLRGQAAQIPTHEGWIRLDTRRFIAKMHRLGLRVDYWTIDDPQQAVALVRRGADGIVTNDPGQIRRALREAGLLAS